MPRRVQSAGEHNNSHSLVKPPTPDSVTAATLARLESLGETHSPQGQAALTLARALDAGAGMAAAAFVKELRSTLKELTPRDGGDDFTRLMASLSTEVRDAASGGSPDQGR